VCILLCVFCAGSDVKSAGGAWDSINIVEVQGSGSKFMYKLTTTIMLRLETYAEIREFFDSLCDISVGTRLRLVSSLLVET